MTRRIIVSITPDPDGVRCGVCRWNVHNVACGFYQLSLAAKVANQAERLECCLAAERKLAAIIEAGEKVRAFLHQFPTYRYHNAIELLDAWDRAVKEAKK